MTAIKLNILNKGISARQEEAQLGKVYDNLPDEQNKVHR